MKRLKKLPIFLTLIVFVSIIIISVSYNNNSVKPVVNNNITENTTQQKVEKKTIVPKKMKGLWVSYITLDMRKSNKTKEAFVKKFDNIVAYAKDKGFNTLIVQVRPFSDALYKSNYFPYSHILAGTQGKNPGYDPLAYMCKACHKNKLAIHAWINPYRISLNTNPKEFSKDNPYIINKSLSTKYNGNLYYNPANSKAMKLITKGVAEIIENYNVDGIQFDDYFYPTQNKSFDKKYYDKYVNNCANNKPMSLSAWRKNNVNILISNVYETIKSINKNVEFGISPQGNIKNNSNLYADVKSWCQIRGYIDYICPQIYFSIDNPALGFEDSLSQWLSLNYVKGVKLYVGLAAYKAGTSEDNGTWQDNSDILSTEYKIAISKKTDGIMLYSYESVKTKSAQKELNNLYRELK